MALEFLQNFAPTYTNVKYTRNFKMPKFVFESLEYYTYSTHTLRTLAIK